MHALLLVIKGFTFRSSLDLCLNVLLYNQILILTKFSVKIILNFHFEEQMGWHSSMAMTIGQMIS